VTDLHVAAGLNLPLEAVTETFAILAVRRAGKSNAAVVMAEEMYDAGLPWVVLDPKGDWWGVRSSATGKGSGLAVVVFGGLHADLPLEPGAGAYIAELVAHRRLTCVLDLSEMSKGDQIRFLVPFAERLLKVNREPLHLFLEEADEYIPQRVMADQARVVGAVGKLVRRGGFRGIGSTLISQRIAVVNKDVLTQVGTLIALRTTSPQDRKAIRDWVETKAGQGEMLESLPSLANGEAWVWSPEFLQTTKRVQFRRRRTFDSGATPKVGEQRVEPTRLADVDLAAIKEAMSEFIERADAQDPAKLHKRIRALEAELARVRAECPEPEIREVRIEVPVVPAEVIDAIAAYRERITEAQNALAVVLDSMPEPAEPSKLVLPLRNRQPAPARVVTPVQRRERPAPDPDGNGVLTPAKQRILDALAWLESVGMEASKPRLALMVDMSPKGGGFNNYLGSLRGAGLIDYPRTGYVALTEAGREQANSGGAISTEHLQEMLFAKVGPSKARILRVLIDAYPQVMSKEDLAAAVEMSPTGGGFNNYLGALRGVGLIDYPAPGSVVALPVLFLES